MAVLLPDCLSATTIRLHGAGHGVRKIFCTVQPKLVLGTVAHRQYSARVIRRAGADSDGGQPKPAECPDARSAIELGRERFASGDYEGASAYFEKASAVWLAQPVGNAPLSGCCGNYLSAADIAILGKLRLCARTSVHLHKPGKQ